MGSSKASIFIPAVIRDVPKRFAPSQYHLRKRMGSSVTLGSSLAHPLTRKALTSDAKMLLLAQVDRVPNKGKSAPGLAAMLWPKAEKDNPAFSHR